MMEVRTRSPSRQIVDQSRPVRSASRTWSRFRRHRLAMVGMLLIALYGVLAVGAPVIAPDGMDDQNLFRIAEGPTAENWLGTDELGRDVLSRLIWGARVSLLVGFGAAVVTTVIGVVVGMLAGYFGGWVDSILMRFVDLILAFPAIFLLLILFSTVSASVWKVALLLGLFSWMWLARVVRNELLSLKRREYVDAARTIGASNLRIVVRHLVPNVAASIIVAATLAMASAMLAEATLSFLGFGVPPNVPTWGNMLTGASAFYLRAPLLAIVPGVVLISAILAINFIGDGLRDALDPRSG